MTVLDYPQCLDELVKYMDFMENDEEARKSILIAFVRKIVCA